MGFLFFSNNNKKNKENINCINDLRLGSEFKVNCVEYCVKDFHNDLNKEEKVCLAKCSDNTKRYFCL